MSVLQRLCLLVALALLPAILIQALNELDLRRSREAELHELALRQAELAASELGQIVGGVRSLLTALATVPPLRALDGATCTTYLADILPKVPHLVGIIVVDPGGRLVCHGDPSPVAHEFGDRAYVQEALSGGGFVVGSYTRDRITGAEILPLALPIEDRDGHAKGVVAAHLSLAWLNAHLRERSLAQGGSLTIADRDGVIIARDPQPERFVGVRIPDTFQALVHATAPGTQELVSQDGTHRILGYMPAGISAAGLYVSAGLSAEASFAAIDRATARGVAMIAVGLGLALLVAWGLGRRLVRPVAGLMRAAARWQAGDYGARADVGPGDGEFALLGATFDRMVEEIARRESALKVSEARLRAAVETLPFDFWICDQDGRYSVQNSTSRRHWGERVGLRPEETDSPPELVARWVTRNSRALAGETLRGEATYLLQGELRMVEDVLAPIESEGAIVGYVGVNIDVTEQRRAEERLRLLLRELSHRVKNTLAIVQVIAARSLQGDRSLAEAREVLVERLRALSGTHDLLTATGWKGASLRSIAEAELRPYGKRAELRGQDVVLAPRAAQTLGLILHELATNAAKHGALSQLEGGVRVSWQLDERKRLRLEWRELRGPVVQQPTRQGFGRMLIEEIVAHELKGSAELCFAPEGVVYRLDAPLAELMPIGAATMSPSPSV
ncbi:MAG: HWE histidine kinase domain-containing protein [Geminicoccaceae bacterium]